MDYIPGREPQDGWGGIGGNGGSDDNGNRVDRFLAGVAYLDGRLPSVLMARGYYGRSVIAGGRRRRPLDVPRRRATDDARGSTLDDAGGPVAAQAIGVRLLDRRDELTVGAGVQVGERVRELPPGPVGDTAGGHPDRHDRDHTGQTW